MEHGLTVVELRKWNHGLTVDVMMMKVMFMLGLHCLCVVVPASSVASRMPLLFLYFEIAGSHSYETGKTTYFFLLNLSFYRLEFKVRREIFS